MLNDEKIIQYMSNFHEEYEKEPIYAYGVIQATFGQTILLGALSSFANKFILVGFTDRKLIILGLDMMGVPNSHCCIYYNDFVSAKIKIGLLGMGKTIKIRLVDNSEVHFSLNKHTIGLKHQKENVEKICELLDRFIK